MKRQPALAGEFPCLFQIGLRQYFAIMSIFNAQQFSAGKVDIVSFDFSRYFIQRQGAISGGIDRLRLNTAQYRRAARFVQVVMRALSDDIFFATLAVA